MLVRKLNIKIKEVIIRIVGLNVKFLPIIKKYKRTFISIRIFKPLPPLKPMGQSRRGVVRKREAKVRPWVTTTPRFIQLSLPLPPLKPMVQSWRGVIRIVEA
jgi:hypothetical protein